MPKRFLVVAALAPLFAFTSCDRPAPLDPVHGPSFNNHKGSGKGPIKGPRPRDSGPVQLAVQVSNAEHYAIRGDGDGDYTEYAHGGCIEAIAEGSKLLELTTAIDSPNCNGGNWRGLLFPAAYFANTHALEGVADLPLVGDDTRRGAVGALNVFNNGTFNLWIRAVGTDGLLRDHSKWAVAFGTVEVIQEDGWSVVRLSPDGWADVREGFGDMHHRHGLRIRWDGAQNRNLPLELRFRPL